MLPEFVEVRTELTEFKFETGKPFNLPCTVQDLQGVLLHGPHKLKVLFSKKR